MIVCRVELWNHGDPNDVEPLGIVLIANNGPVEGSDADLYGYQVQLQEAFNTKRVNRRVTHWRRRGWKVLVRKAMEAVL